MTYSGIVFDFNGTLFLDSPMHEKAWIQTAKALFDITVTPEQYYRELNGKENKLIMDAIMGSYTPDQLMQAEVTKEETYRRLCLKEPGFIRFTEGAEALFDWLTERGIPMSIATASEISNMKFYWEQFRLERWFTPERVIYNDHTFPLKPNPDIYFKAAQALGVPPEKLVICEDSGAGLRAAKAAGAGYIYAIAAGAETAMSAGLMDAVIPDFTYFDRSLF
ncbi:MAG: HAD family phosphatase [Clostridia bacterium]|nr:HAD family phosphatase [Clostridia bacterium]